MTYLYLGLTVYALGVLTFLSLYMRRIILDWQDTKEWMEVGGEVYTMGSKGKCDTFWKTCLDRKIFFGLMVSLLSWIVATPIIIAFVKDAKKSKLRRQLI